MLFMTLFQKVKNLRFCSVSIDLVVTVYTGTEVVVKGDSEMNKTQAFSQIKELIIP